MSVKTAVAQEIHTVKSKGLKIGATNPSLSELAAAFPNDVLKSIARHESGARQFMADPGCKALYPLFSGDNLGGVGLFQITRPAPSPEQIWDWRANLAAGISIYESKRKVAKGYKDQCESLKRFIELRDDYNRQRRLQNKSDLQITLAEFTLHEFEIPVVGSKLVVSNIDEKKQTGEVIWQRTPASKRYHLVKRANGKEGLVMTGDANYVSNVRGASSF